MDLCENAIDVISFSLDGESIFPLALGETWLSSAERERAGRFRFGELRNRFIRGRAMVRHVLSRYLDRSPADLSFETGDHGKPFLATNEIHFNLSHSLDQAVLAVSHLPSIGIDVERFDREVDFDRLAERCFRPSEWERFRDREPDLKAEAFFWIWTAKEARMKATGEGFRLEPRRIEVDFENDVPHRFREPASPRAYLSPVRFRGLAVACTVAALSPFQVRVLSRDLEPDDER